jgi:hypothetical protein
MTGLHRRLLGGIQKRQGTHQVVANEWDIEGEIKGTELRPNIHHQDIDTY